MKISLLAILLALAYVPHSVSQLSLLCGPSYLSLPIVDWNCGLNISEFQVLTPETFKKWRRLIVIQLTGVKRLERYCFSGMKALREVYITNGSLVQIRKGIFNNSKLSAVHLENNRISEIDDKAFARIRKLDSLSLSNNKLEYIKKSWFEGCSIDDLRLDGNLITQLDGDTFSKLTAGNTLFLSDNKIHSIQNGTFSNFHVVYLDGNLICEGNFFDNARLQFMSLANNKLMYIKFTRHTIINEIEIYSNPWICDCLQKFWKMAKIKNTKVVQYLCRFHGCEEVCNNNKYCQIIDFDDNAAVCNATIKTCPYL